MITRYSRRSWLVGSSAGLALCASAKAKSVSAAEKLRVAAVGVKGMGWSDLSSVGSHAAVQFVGFCDIDTQRFDQVDEKFPGVPHFADYREMIAKLGAGVDAVIVSTPDHMHAPIATLAMSQGKHVYCQKPLTHTVWEARQMQLLARQHQLTTQMGNQIHSAKPYRMGVRLVRDGWIGKVKEVHSWVGVQGRQHCNRTDRPASGPVPANVAWDLWLGCAPERPFAPDVYHPFKWRDWQAFGSGALGDFGCHIFDPVFGALSLTAPTSIVAEHAGTNDEVWPGPETVRYLFPGTKHTAGDTIQVTWYDGGLKPSADLLVVDGKKVLPEDKKLPGAGSVFIGEEGVMVLPHYADPQLYPIEKYEGKALPDVQGTNHWHDWVDAVLAGKQTTDGFDYAGPLTEAVQLGNVAALVPGTPLQWDSASMQLTGAKDVERLLTKKYRKGFEVIAAK